MREPHTVEGESRLKRRNLLATAMLAGAGAGAVGLVAPEDAAAATDDVLLDRGGAVFNVRSSAYAAATDKATIQKAIDAVPASGGTVYLPAGSYTIDGPLVGKPGLSIRGAGASSTFVHVQSSGSPGVMYEPASVPGPVALSADLSEHATSASTSGTFNAGDLILFNANDASLGGWVARAKGSNASGVDLQDPCPTQLRTADGAQCRRIAQDAVPRDFSICDIALVGDSQAPPATLLQLRYVENAVVERVHFENASGQAVFVTDSRNVTLRDCVAVNVLQNNTALGFNAFQVTGLQVSGCEAHNCSTGVTLSGCPESVVTGCRLHGNVDQAGRGLKLIARSNYCVAHGNVINGFATSHTGIHITDTWGCTVTGNVVANTGTAINVSNALDTGDNHHLVIKGNVLRNVTTGVNLSNSRSPVPPEGRPSYSVVEGNTIDGCDSGIALACTRNVVRGNTVTNFGANHGITLWSGSNENLIEGNVIVADGTKRAINVVAGPNPNFIAGNFTPTDAVNLGTGSIDQFTPLVKRGTISVSSGVAQPDLVKGSYQTLTLSDTSAVTVRGPRPATPGAEFTLDVKNSSGGSPTVTLDSTAYATPAGGFGQLADTKRRVVNFRYDGSKWVETSRSGDI